MTSRVLASLLTCGLLAGCSNLPLPDKATELQQISGAITAQLASDPNLRFPDYLTSEAKMRLVIDRVQLQYEQTSTGGYALSEADPEVVPSKVADSTTLRGKYVLSLPNTLPGTLAQSAVMHSVPASTPTCQTINVADASRYASYAKAYGIMSHPSLGLEGGKPTYRYLTVASLNGSQEVELYYAPHAGEIKYDVVCRQALDQDSAVILRQSVNLNLRQGWNLAVVKRTTTDGLTTETYTTQDAGDEAIVNFIPVDTTGLAIKPLIDTAINENCEDQVECLIP